jgi:hypothetical protein
MADTQISEHTTTTTHTVVGEKPKQDLLSNALAIAGLVILAVIVIWGVLHLVSLFAPSFSSLFSSTPRIQVTAPSSATSGTPFTVNWSYSPSEKGTYAFLYSCKDGLQFQTASVIGAMNAVPCGAAYTVGTVTSLTLTPKLSSATSTDATLSIIFIPSATSSKQVQGSTTVRINSVAVVQPVGPVQSVQTTKSAPAKTSTKSSYAGPADLSVSITSAVADQYGNATVVFDIANVGGSASGSYYFSAQLPTMSGTPYTSPEQASLNTGDHVVNTLRFSQATGGTFSVSLNISDANQSSNYASTMLSMPYYGNNYYSGPTYQSSYPQPSYSNQPYYQYQYNQPYPNYNSNPYPMAY